MTGTILVVEDSSTQRRLIAGLLASNDFKVKVAKNGGEGLKRAVHSHPDLVVLDVLMPDMNGYEVCRQLKKHPETQKIPVILCSIKNSEVDRYWGKKNGADAYLAKPFQQDELIATIERLLNPVA